jgi:hypothetical protein
MKLSTSILGLAFAATSIATPAAPQSTILPPSAPQPASIYPIGRPGSFAKVSRRVFEIDGKKQYFSGILAHRPGCKIFIADILQVATHGGLLI